MLLLRVLLLLLLRIAYVAAHTPTRHPYLSYPTHINRYISIIIQICVYVYLCMYVYAYVYVCVYIYICTPIKCAYYIYIYIYSPAAADRRARGRPALRRRVRGASGDQREPLV